MEFGPISRAEYGPIVSSHVGHPRPAAAAQAALPDPSTWSLCVVWWRSLDLVLMRPHSGVLVNFDLFLALQGSYKPDRNSHLEQSG